MITVIIIAHSNGLYWWLGSMLWYVSAFIELLVVFITGAVDELNSPSARLTVGRVMKAGTGCFDVIVPVSVWYVYSDTGEMHIHGGRRLVQLYWKQLNCSPLFMSLSLQTVIVKLLLQDWYDTSAVSYIRWKHFVQFLFRMNFLQVYVLCCLD